MLRPGILRYPTPQGERVEYRPPEETFRADVLAALRGAPVTDQHPPGMITPETWRTYARGHVADDVRQDGEHVVGALVIQDGTLLAKVGTREQTELSVGYLIDWEPTPGVAPDGTRYDGVQRNVRPNHVAVVEHGRAGPTVALRLDAAGNQDPCATVEPMKERIDGVEYTIGTPEHAAALVKHERAQAERNDAQTRLQAERDGATAKLADLQARHDALEASIPKRVQERVALVREAQGLGLKPEDTQTDEQIERAILGKLNPALRLDGKDRAYVRASLDYARAAAPRSFREGLGAALDGEGARLDASENPVCQGANLDEAARARGRQSTLQPKVRPSTTTAPSVMRGEN